MWYVYFFCLALAFRLGTLWISVRHENALKKGGAIEYGRANSRLLAGVHTAFYISVIVEAVLLKPSLDGIAVFGMLLYFLGASVLMIVIKLLGPLWTVKLYLSRNHVLVRHRLFLFFRHPNYFLAILPELAGLAVGLHAFWVLLIGLAVYAIPLARRISEETSVMKAHFPEY